MKLHLCMSFFLALPLQMVIFLKNFYEYDWMHLSVPVTCC